MVISEISENTGYGVKNTGGQHHPRWPRVFFAGVAGIFLQNSI